MNNSSSKTKDTPMLIVFDLDDTIADTTHRHHILDAPHNSETLKWNAFYDLCEGDTIIPEIADIFDALTCHTFAHRVEIWTGRSERVRRKTYRWLTQHLHGFSACRALRMRGQDDFRPTTHVKAEWMQKFGIPDLTFDDNNTAVEWWREQGVTCCQVRESQY